VASSPETLAMICHATTFSDTREILCRHARHRIRRKARQLIGKAGLRWADRDDLEQELTLRLWRGLRDFDPALGSPGAFVATVLERAAHSILRLRNSEKRSCRYVRQLGPAPAMQNDGEPDESCGDIASPSASHEAAVDLTHDVAIVLQTLPSPLRALAEELKHRGISEIAVRSGCSRSTIYARVAQLRAAFRFADQENPRSESDTLSAFCEVI
jgi:RNA polymerase sigma factor (sigma-70 family)